MQDFRKLKVWEKAHALTLAIYRATQRSRRSDFPGLVPQLRRAAASIPANIAEGCGHEGPKELARYLQMSMASACEVEYFLILGVDLTLIQRTTFVDLETKTKEVKRMLTSLIQKVRAGSRDGATKASRRQVVSDRSSDH